MSLLGSGWEVICPDGCVRHWPYVDRDGAETEARIFSAGACGSYRKATALETNLPRCPGGSHSVRPTAFLARAAAKGAA